MSLQVLIIWIFSSKLKKMFTGLNSENAPKFYSLHLQKHWFSKFLNSPWNIRSQNKKIMQSSSHCQAPGHLCYYSNFCGAGNIFSLRIEIIARKKVLSLLFQMMQLPDPDSPVNATEC